MDKKEFTVSEVIDSIGISSHTWVVFVLLAFAMIFDGYDFMIINSTNLFVAHTFWPDNPNPGALMGSLTTWGLLGMVLGGAVGGVISDRIGRKKTLVVAVMFYGLFTLPQAFANDIVFFAVFRLIAGFGVGSCIPVVTTVFSESMPSKQRGVFVTFGMAFMVVGWVLAGLVANPICNTPTPIIPGLCNEVTYALADGGTATMYANWRLCYLIGALPVVYGIVLIFCMHETPHWYANSGNKEMACERLTQIEQATRHTSHEYDPNLLIVPPKPEKVGPTVLFSSKFIVATAAIWTAYFIGQFCVYGMNAWLPAWFTDIGYSASDAVTLQTLNNVGAILSNISVGFVSDKVGRKRTLGFSWLFCIVAIVICSLFVAPNSFVLCIGLMLLFGFALNFAITAVQPMMPEAYPTAIRNTRRVVVPGFRSLRRFGFLHRARWNRRHGLVPDGCGNHQLVDGGAGAHRAVRVGICVLRAVRQGNGEQDDGPACGRRGEAGQFRNRRRRALLAHDRGRVGACGAVHRVPACDSRLVVDSCGPAAHGCRHPAALRVLLCFRRHAAGQRQEQAASCLRDGDIAPKRFSDARETALSALRQKSPARSKPDRAFRCSRRDTLGAGDRRHGRACLGALR